MLREDDRGTTQRCLCVCEMKTVIRTFVFTLIKRLLNADVLDQKDNVSLQF